MGIKGRIAIIAVAVNGFLMVIKISAGLFTGSVAMISDGVHSATDLLATIAAWLSIRVSSRPADSCHPYGHGKFENLAALAQGVLVLAATVAIVRQAVMRLLAPAPLLETSWGIAVMLVAIVSHSLVCSRMIVVARKTQSPALAGASLHMLTDIGSSIAVIIGLIITSVSGWVRADALAALGVSALVLWGAIRLLVDACRDLVDSSISPREYNQLQAVFREHMPPVKSFHRLRARRVGATHYVDAHLVVDGALSVEQAHELCDHLEAHVSSRLPNSRTLLHVEPEIDNSL